MFKSLVTHVTVCRHEAVNGHYCCVQEGAILNYRRRGCKVRVLEAEQEK